MKKLISINGPMLAVMLLALVCSLPCWAGEMAVLRNGFSIRHERREVVGDVTRLYVTADGSSYVDVRTAEIEHFEEAELQASAQPRTDAGCRGSTLAGSPKPDCRSPKPNLDEVVNAASGRYRLDPDLVSSVIKAESGFNVRAEVVAPGTLAPLKFHWYESGAVPVAVTEKVWLVPETAALDTG